MSETENPFRDENIEKALDEYREKMTQDPNTPTSEIIEFDQKRIKATKIIDDMYDRMQLNKEKMQESDGIDWVGKALAGIIVASCGLMILGMICVGILMIKMTIGGS